MAKAGKATTDTKKAELAELETLQQQVVEKEELYRRALADYRNLQQQTQQERARLIQMAASGVVEDLLPTLDHLEMALQHFKDPSLQMIADSLMQTLQNHGLVRIEAAGMPFDHETMEAVDTAAGEKDVVVQVRRNGYRLNGNVIRHAQVVVGDGVKNA
jgi:molecular chaperone GrpE